MCPLRVILIFLSATLAGFFVLRNLRSQPHLQPNNQRDDALAAEPQDPIPPSSKVRSAISKGFWTCVDAASGRYLWRNLMASSSSSSPTVFEKKSTH